jgi:hypothetical protein
VWEREVLHNLSQHHCFSWLHMEWHIHSNLDISHVGSLILFKLLESAHRFVPLNSDVNVSNSLHNNVLGNMIQFSDALQCNVTPALVVGALVNLNAIIV